MSDLAIQLGTAKSNHNSILGSCTALSVFVAVHSVYAVINACPCTPSTLLTMPHGDINVALPVLEMIGSRR